MTVQCEVQINRVIFAVSQVLHARESFDLNKKQKKMFFFISTTVKSFATSKIFDIFPFK